VTNPDMAAVVRNMKVPERMTNSRALRDFLLSQLEEGEATSRGQTELTQLIELLILSHLEVVDALGALEGPAAEKPVEKFRDEVSKKYRRRRWL
jgi:hypothetical protein